MALLLLLFSLRSIGSMRSLVLGSIPAGYEQRFTPSLYSHIVLGLRLLTGLLCMAAIGLFRFAGALGRRLQWAADEIRKLAVQVVAGTKSLARDRLYALAWSAILIWGVALRLVFLAEPIRKDEAYTYLYYASRPFYVGLTYYTANNHMLNTVLMHISTAVFGPSLWSVRLPTFLAGVMLLPMTYAATRLYHGGNAALLAMALISGSSPMIEYSSNARGYELGALFLMAAVVCLGFAERGFEGAWLILPVTAALSLYAVPTMLYGVAGLFLYIVLKRFDLRWKLFAIVATGLLTIAFYAPTLPVGGVSAIVANRWIEPLPWNQWKSQIGAEPKLVWLAWMVDDPLAVGLALAVGVLAVMFSRRVRVPPLAILLCSLAAAAVLLPLQRVIPYRRIWFFLLPFYLSAGAVGIVVILERIRRVERASMALAIGAAVWMGVTVLHARSMQHDPQAVGCRSAESIVVNTRKYLQAGDQFICWKYFDSPLDFYLRLHHVEYHPEPTGKLLILTPRGQSPELTLENAGISPRAALSMQKIGAYEDADIYRGERSPSLTFQPAGSPEMGAFTTIGTSR